MKLLPLFALLLLAGCISSTQMAAAQALAELYNEGVLTTEQFQMLQAALLEGGRGWLNEVITGGVTMAASIAGIRLWRGPSATPVEKMARRTQRATRPASLPPSANPVS